MAIPTELRAEANALALEIRLLCQKLGPTFAARRVAELLAHAGGELEKEIRESNGTTKKAAPVREAAQPIDEIPM